MGDWSAIQESLSNAFVLQLIEVAAMRATTTILLLILVTIGIFSTIYMSRLRYALFPPDDLYAPLVISPLNTPKDISNYSVTFKNKYTGRHIIGLIVDNPPPIGESYEIDNLALAIAVSQNGKVLIEQTTDESVYPFWGHSGQYSGLALVNYKVPDELPRNQELQCEIIIENSRAAFMQKYDNIRLFIAKISDK